MLCRKYRQLIHTTPYLFIACYKKNNIYKLASTDDICQIGLNALMRQIAISFRGYFTIQRM